MAILKMYRCSFDKKRVEILILPFLIGFSAKMLWNRFFLEPIFCVKVLLFV